MPKPGGKERRDTRPEPAEGGRTKGVPYYYVYYISVSIIILLLLLLVVVVVVVVVVVCCFVCGENMFMSMQRRIKTCTWSGPQYGQD